MTPSTRRRDGLLDQLAEPGGICIHGGGLSRGAHGARAAVHFAAVNVNFWITPDDANLSSDSGGLIVWDKEAPLDWEFERFSHEHAAIITILYGVRDKP